MPTRCHRRPRASSPTPSSRSIRWMASPISRWGGPPLASTSSGWGRSSNRAPLVSAPPLAGVGGIGMAGSSAGVMARSAPAGRTTRPCLATAVSSSFSVASASRIASPTLDRMRAGGGRGSGMGLKAKWQGEGLGLGRKLAHLLLLPPVARRRVRHRVVLRLSCLHHRRRLVLVRRREVRVELVRLRLQILGVHIGRVVTAAVRRPAAAVPVGRVAPRRVRRGPGHVNLLRHEARRVRRVLVLLVEQHPPADELLLERLRALVPRRIAALLLVRQFEPPRHHHAGGIGRLPVARPAARTAVRATTMRP